MWLAKDVAVLTTTAACCRMKKQHFFGSATGIIVVIEILLCKEATAAVEYRNPTAAPVFGPRNGGPVADEEVSTKIVMIKVVIFS